MPDLAALYTDDLNTFSTDPLSRSEEIEVFRRIRAGDQAAVEIIVNANIRFVRKIAQDFLTSGLPLPELIANGNLGLMVAIEKFDPEKGLKFITYAVWWIKARIREAINDQRTVKSPYTAIADARKIDRVTEAMEQAEEREPTLEELCVSLDLPEERVLAAQRARWSARSLDAPLVHHGHKMHRGRGVEDRNLIDAIPAPEPTDELTHFDGPDLNGAIDRICQGQDRMREILYAYFGLDQEPMTLQEIGDEMGITRERVRQIIQQAVSLLRADPRLCDWMGADPLTDEILGRHEQGQTPNEIAAHFRLPKTWVRRMIEGTLEVSA